MHLSVDFPRDFSVIAGLGFGIPGLFGIRHLARTGDIWALWGFPTFGHGPFERLGLPTTVPLMAAFLIVNAVEVVEVALILADAPGATVISTALVPFEFAFWIGFALPFGPPVGIARVVLLLLA